LTSYLTSQATIGESVRPVELIHSEVQQRFGVLSNFFRLAPESPEITANSWGAPLRLPRQSAPLLFKERLFVHLSRFCEAPYCAVRRLGFIVASGAGEACNFHRRSSSTGGEFSKMSANGESIVMLEEHIHKQPTTLGDVLYANSKAPVPEQDWATLVQSIAAGDQLALHALYEMAHRLVFTLIMRITANRETAEELTIDVFHDVWRRASHYDAANGTVLGWIMNQARSRAIDRLRFESRKKRSQGGDAPPLADVAPDPYDVLELREQGELLRAALEALTPDERQAIEATFFGGLTHAEAAARLDQPLGTIKTRIRSGLHKLRRTLTAEGRKP
jgi:RNA polymerase sigma-70 factor (ECF subfamily)